MEEEHQRISNDEDHKIDLEPTIVDEVEQGLLLVLLLVYFLFDSSNIIKTISIVLFFSTDIHELSITPIPETFQDEIEEEQVETIQPQVIFFSFFSSFFFSIS